MSVAQFPTGESIAAALTRCVGELLLLPLDPVLERLRFATCLLDAGLHRLWRHVARPAWIHLCECALSAVPELANGRRGVVGGDGRWSELSAEGVARWRLGRLNAAWKNASSRGAIVGPLKTTGPAGTGRALHRNERWERVERGCEVRNTGVLRSQCRPVSLSLKKQMRPTPVGQPRCSPDAGCGFGGLGAAGESEKTGGGKDFGAASNEWLWEAGRICDYCPALPDLGMDFWGRARLTRGV